MVVSFGKVVDHPDDEAFEISDSWGKHPDDEASGMRGTSDVPGSAGFWVWSHEGPWVGWLANGTGPEPRPMVPTSGYQTKWCGEHLTNSVSRNACVGW